MLMPNVFMLMLILMLMLMVMCVCYVTLQSVTLPLHVHWRSCKLRCACHRVRLTLQQASLLQCNTALPSREFALSLPFPPLSRVRLL